MCPAGKLTEKSPYYAETRRMIPNGRIKCKNNHLKITNFF